MNIGHKIRRLREEKGYSQEYMAHALDMSQNNYSKIELGKVGLTWARVELIARVLEMDPINIVKPDDEMIFNNHNQQGGTAANIVLQEISEKMLEAKDQTIQALTAEIDFLRQTNLFLQEELRALRERREEQKE